LGDREGKEEEACGEGEREQEASAVKREPAAEGEAWRLEPSRIGSRRIRTGLRHPRKGPESPKSACFRPAAVRT
jgi:hypothetical protein